MKLLAPQLPAALSSWSGIPTTGEDIRNSEVSSAEWMGIEIDRLVIDSARLYKVRAPGCSFPHLRLWHSILEQSDLSGGQWLEAVLDRVVFRECRLARAFLSASEWKHVLLQDCRIEEANFRQSKLAEVRFVGCRLNGADFSGCKLENVSFEGCDLGGVTFRGSQMKEVDFRTSKIAELANADGLSGGIFEAHQLLEIAPQMASKLGIRIFD